MLVEQPSPSRREPDLGPRRTGRRPLHQDHLHVAAAPLTLTRAPAIGDHDREHSGSGSWRPVDVTARGELATQVVERRYHAFLSYSHWADRALAAALQTSIERFLRPTPFRWRMHVFRDETDLAATPDLWGTILLALADSEYMIVLANPFAAKSPWVAKEIQEFLTRPHAPGRKATEWILVVLTDGSAPWIQGTTGESAVPAVLATAFRDEGVEPFLIDLRELRQLEHRQLRDSPKLEEAGARLSARLLGRDLQSLWGEHRRVARRWQAIIGVATAVLLLTLGGAMWALFERQKLIGSNAALTTRGAELAQQNDKLEVAGKQKQEENAELEKKREGLEQNNNELNRKAAKFEADARIAEAKASALRVENTKLGGNVAVAKEQLEDARTKLDGAQRQVVTETQKLEQLGAQNKQLDATVIETRRGLQTAQNRLGTAAEIAARAPAAAEDALVAALEGAAPSIEDKTALSLEVRRGLAAALGAAGGARVLGRRDQGSHVVLVCPERDLVITQDRYEGVIERSIASKAQHKLTGVEGSYVRGACASSRGVVVLQREAKGHPVVEAFTLDEPRRITPMKGELWNNVAGLALAADGSVAATVTSDGMIYVWDTASGERLHRFRRPDRIGSSAVFSPDGKLLIVDGNAKITVWNWREETLLSTVSGQIDVKASGQWAPGGQVMLATDKNRVPVLSLAGGLEQTLPGNSKGTWAAAFDRDARRVVVAGSDGTAAVMDRAGRTLAVLRGHEGAVRAAMFSPDGAIVATVGIDHTARLWDASTGALLRSFFHADPLEDYVAFSHDGSRLVSVTSAGTAHLWSTRAGVYAGTRNGECGALIGSASWFRTTVSRDGRHAILFSVTDEKICVVDIATGRTEAELAWHLLVRNATLSPDARYLMVAHQVGVSRFDLRTPGPSTWTRTNSGVGAMTYNKSGSRFSYAENLQESGVIHIMDATRAAEIARFSVRELPTSLYLDDASVVVVGLKSGGAIAMDYSDAAHPTQIGSSLSAAPSQTLGELISSHAAEVVGADLPDTVEVMARGAGLRRWNFRTDEATMLGETRADFMISAFPPRLQFDFDYDFETKSIVVTDRGSGALLTRFDAFPPTKVIDTRPPEDQWQSPSNVFVVEHGASLLVLDRDGWLRKWYLPEPVPERDDALVEMACRGLSAISPSRPPARACILNTVARH